MDFKFPFIKIGKDPEKNALSSKYMNAAFKFALDKRYAQNVDRSDFDAALNNVKNFASIYLRFVIGLIGIYTATSVLSGVHGLVGGLTEGLSQGDIVGGVIGAVRGAAAGLATGAYSGFGDFLYSLQSISK